MLLAEAVDTVMAAFDKLDNLAENAPSTGTNMNSQETTGEIVQCL